MILLVDFQYTFPYNLINKEENITIQVICSLQPNIQTPFCQNLKFSFYFFAQQWEVNLKNTSVKQVADIHVHVLNSSVCCYTRISVGLLLLFFFSLPVTVASTDRYFSKLKYIKHYLLNSVAQECFKGLALNRTLRQNELKLCTWAHF